jgi:hypothetical protein
MKVTVYVLGKTEPVFKGNVDLIPAVGHRVMVEGVNLVVESISWALDEDGLIVRIYLMDPWA